MGAAWRRRCWLLVAAAAALPALLPLVSVAAGFLDADPAVLEHLRRHVLPRVSLNTLWLVTGVVSGATVLGSLLAWLVAVHEFPGRRFFGWALLLPMAVPGYVMAFVYIGLLDYAGPVQGWLREAFGPGAGLPPIRSTGGVIAVMTLTLYPYVYLISRGAFASMGRRCLEAGQSLGLSRARSLLRVALPMARPWIVAGALLVAMETLADFGTVSAFNYDTFTTAIYKAWFGMFSVNAALHLAGFLLLPVLAVLALETRLRGRARYAPTAADAQRRLRLTGMRGWGATAVCSLVLAVAFLVPFAQLAAWALDTLLNDNGGFAGRAAQHSLLLGLAAAGIVITLALLLSYARRLNPGPVGMVLSRVAVMGYALPGPVLAVGVFVPLAAVSGWLSAWWGGTWVLHAGLGALLVGYLARFMAVGHAPVDAGMQRITPRIDDAATSLGQSGLGRLFRVHLPMLRGGLFAGAALVFVDVLKEMPITLMIRPHGWDTLAVQIYQFTAEGQWERAALPGVMLVLAGLIPVVLLTRGAERLHAG